MRGDKIETAKQEWEAAVDVLPELICLLDAQGRVMQANRTVERWELGGVIDFEGHQVHALLHPLCSRLTCYLERFWHQAWQDVTQGKTLTCEAEDEWLKRYLHLDLRPIGAPTQSGVQVPAPFAVFIAHDITLRKQAEQALQLSEERYRHLVENSQRLICTHDLHGTLLYVNPASAAMLGYQPAEMVGKNGGDFLPPSVRDLYDAYLERIRQQRTDAGFMCVMTKAGEKRIWQYHNVLCDVSGSPSYVLGHAQDVSERIRLEETLQESRERFRDLVEGSIQGIMIQRHYKPLFVNQAYAVMHGYDAPDDILSLDTMWPLIVLSAQPLIRQYYEDRLQGQQAPPHYEYQGVRKDGSVIWLDNKVRVITWDGEPAVLYTVYDITARKQVEVALQESETQLRLVMDHVPVIIAYVDTELRYRFANTMFETWYGLSPEDVRGKRVIDVIGEAAFQAIQGSLREVLAGHTVSLEVLIPYQYGGSRYVRATYVPHVVDQGQVCGYFALVEDITDYKRVETQLTETLEQVAKSHDDLVALLNHLRVGTILLDEDGRVTFLSQTCQRLLGISNDVAMHQEWEHIFPCSLQDKARLKDICGRPLPARYRVPMRLEPPGGRQYWVDIEVQDDPREPRRKIFLVYDMSELRDLRRLLDERGEFEQMVGKSAAMQHVYRLIRRVAQVETTVLIAGETGTGKELVARAIHNTSPRRSKPFIAVNCAGLSEAILGSELFGHKRGAFTGAIADHQGLFEAANGGTLFLDEIGDMPLSVQTSLLRVLQEREITRLGESTPRPIDVRILAATQHNLDDEVSQGRFRADLLYRIRVIRLWLPALRERREDIPLLVNAFLADKQTALNKSVQAVSQEAMQRLPTYAWPGNVRELNSAVEFAVLHCMGTVIQPEDLPPEIIHDIVPGAPFDISPDDERQCLLEALRRARGNRSRAARLLGIGRTTFYRHLARLGISPDELPSRYGGSTTNRGQEVAGLHGGDDVGEQGDP